MEQRSHGDAGELKKKQRRRHRCKLCSRRFSCGRALGGHMRSHASDSSSSSPSPTSSCSSSFPPVPHVLASPEPPTFPTEEEGAAAWVLVRLSRAHWPEQHPLEAGAHTCPFCGRVFASGQALGGHKKSHRYRPPAPRFDL